MNVDPTDYLCQASKGLQSKMFFSDIRYLIALPNILDIRNIRQIISRYYNVFRKKRISYIFFCNSQIYRVDLHKLQQMLEEL